MGDDQKKKSPVEEMPSVDETKPTDLEQLEANLQKARESELRAMADYQNLVRRTQEERLKIVKFANLGLMESLLQPLDHLYLAQEQLKDPGLEMVCQQFKQVLQDEGLAEIAVMDQEFDAGTMEVVNKEKVPDAKQDQKVIKVMQRGYRLNDEVIRHAKVTIGEFTK